jgi:hypothetical protein
MTYVEAVLPEKLQSSKIADNWETMVLPAEENDPPLNELELQT